MADTLIQLDTGRIHLVDHKISRIYAEIPSGHKPTDLLESHYWAHHSRRFQSGRTIITALWEDLSCYMELLVTQSGANFAIVKTLRLVNLVDTPESYGTAKYEARWLNKQDKHGVIRVGDQSLMKSGFHSMKDAEAYIVELE